MSLTISSSQLVQQAKARIKEITALDALGLFDHADVVIVDIRDIRERQREGYIPGSIHAPRGMIEFLQIQIAPTSKPYLAKINDLFSTALQVGDLR